MLTDAILKSGERGLFGFGGGVGGDEGEDALRQRQRRVVQVLGFTHDVRLMGRRWKSKRNDDGSRSKWRSCQV